MTKQEQRFELAKAAMQGMLSNPNVTAARKDFFDKQTAIAYSKFCVDWTDAMLEELENGEEKQNVMDAVEQQIEGHVFNPDYAKVLFSSEDFKINIDNIKKIIGKTQAADIIKFTSDEYYNEKQLEHAIYLALHSLDKKICKIEIIKEVGTYGFDKINRRMYSTKHDCPHCESGQVRYESNYAKDNYCPNCGSKIEWV
jgi:hypothetical protein